MLFRLCRDEKRLGEGNLKESPSRALLEGLVWSPGSWLFPEVPSQGKWFGRFTPELAHPAEAENFLGLALDEKENWRSRALFPTYQQGIPDHGQIVWADVHAIPAQTAKKPLGGNAVLIAPWSRYVARLKDPESDASETDFSHLQQDIVAALRTIEQGRESTEFDPGKFLYLIDLVPISVTDLTTSHFQPAELLSRLTPQSHSIGGPSLGLAIALAAWAAHRRRSLAPLVATGSIDRKGIVGVVGGIPQKARAFLEFTGDRPFPFLVPVASSDSDKRSLMELRNLRKRYVSQQSLTLFIDDRLLTDGFDHYRKMIGMDLDVKDRSRSPLTPLEVNAEDSSDETGFSRSDEIELNAAADQIVAGLKSEFTDPLPSGESIATFTVPFNEEPKLAAFALAGRIISDEWWKAQQGRWGHLPVVLPIDLVALITGSRASLGFGRPLTSNNLPGRLADAIPDELKPKPPSLPIGEDTFANALRNSGKLILLVYDVKSLDLWKRIHDDSTRYLKTLSLLRFLATDPQQGDLFWRRQRIIPICSDWHHRQLWLGEESSQKSSTAASKRVRGS
jgi:hypothetical protein